MSRAAVFLDRDGVIIENRLDYVKSWSEVTFLPGALEALARLATTPFAIVVITNQSPIGRGLMSEEVVRQIHSRLREAIAAHGGRVDAIYYCPHRPDEGCDCRKPQPGLLLRAVAELHLDMDGSYMVGDAASDVEAARAVGAQPVLVLTGRGQDQIALLDPKLRQACAVVEDLAEAVDRILHSDGEDDESTSQ